MFQQNPDAYAFTWFLNWWPFALTNGLDPFHTDYLGQPVGYNLWWTTSVPTLALLGWPITALAGAVATWNILLLSSVALSAYGCYWLLLYLTKSELGAFVGGLLYGFSTYQTSHLAGHICLTFLPLVPLMLLLAVARANGDLGRGKFVLALTLCAVAQFGISAEVLATFGLFAAISFAAFYPAYRRTVDMHGLAIDVAVCVIFALLLVSPALVSMYGSRHTVPAALRGGEFFSTDLLNFIVPHPLTWLGGDSFEWVSSRFTGGYIEEGAYLGLPLVAIAGLAAWEWRRERWMLPLLAVLLGGVLLTLGPVLQVGGFKTSIPLPWAAVEAVPVIRHALPMRLTMYVSLAVSVLVAVWLCAPSDRIERIIVAIAACAFLLPNPRNYSFTAVQPDPVLSSAAAASAHVDDDDTVLVIPEAPLGLSMIWQIESGMRYKMAGGYLGVPPVYFTKYPGWHALNYGHVPVSKDEFLNDFTAYVALTKVDVVAFNPAPSVKAPMNAMSRELLKLPWERTTNGMTIFLKVPPAESLEFVAVRGDYWGDPLSKDFWIGKRVEVVNQSAGVRTVTLSRFAAPLALGPIDIATTVAGSTTHRQMLQEPIRIEVPARSTAEVVMDKTWVPSEWMGIADSRSLSIVMRVEGWGD